MARARTLSGSSAPAAKLAQVLAILAMVLQVVFAAEHLSAVAARATGTAPAGIPIGLFQICTGEGLVRLVPKGGSGDHRGGGTQVACAVCASACVGGFDLSGGAQPGPPAVFVAIWRISLPHSRVFTHKRALSDGPPRAPPHFPA